MLKRVPERHHTLSLVLLRVTTDCITCKYICILGKQVLGLGLGLRLGLGLGLGLGWD